MKIPKIIHHIWIGGNPFPEDFEYYRNRWITNHPDWDYKFWTDDNLPTLYNQKTFDSTEGIVLKADLLKIDLLYQFGGIFVDSDMDSYKNIETILKNIEIFSCGEKEGIIGNAIIGSIPKHPLMLKILEAMPKSIEKNVDYGPNVKTGPVFLTKLLKNDPIHIFPSQYFFPLPPNSQEEASSEKFPNSYGCHMWAGSWIGKEDKKNWEKWVNQNKDWKEEFEK
jgi:mannosyltransferase OCH1-like enzyme